MTQFTLEDGSYHQCLHPKKQKKKILKTRKKGNQLVSRKTYTELKAFNYQLVRLGIPPKALKRRFK